MGDIAIIGSGYVGLVTGACLSEYGWRITCVDKDENKIIKLSRGDIPISEPGLKSLINRNILYKRLNFTTNIKKAIEDNKVIFISVGTPPMEDGNVDMTYVLEVAREIGKYMNIYKVIVNKSTVPVGTGQKVKTIIRETLKERKIDIKYDVISNPEFLREGSAIYDFTHPDRVVVGAESDSAIKIMKMVYRILYMENIPFLITNIETAELIKYASNAFLATKISFINELSELCEKVNADVQQVAKGMGMDKRIGQKFLHAGPGYGGSCLPKDTKAIVKIGNEYNCSLGIIKATIAANDKQKIRIVDKIIKEMGNVNGKVLGILGLSFKNNTNDMREAPSITILSELAKKGAKFKVYDPKALDESIVRLSPIKENILMYCKDEYEACNNSDALIIITEWDQFKELDLKLIKSTMRGDYFFDLRNIYTKQYVLEKGFKYISIGR